MWRQTVPGMSSNNQEYLVIDDGKSRVRWTIGALSKSRTAGRVKKRSIAKN